MAEQERTPKVLIVDDDPRLRDLLRRYLGDNGFSVSVADGAPAMNRIWMRERFDALILDLMLPGEDGLQILRRLRASKDMTPVLMLTARGEDVDRIVGLELGADDYIAKPFNPRELLARIHAVLRRRPRADEPGAPSLDKEVVVFGEFELDLGRRELRKNGETVSLTTGEFAVLKAFARHPRVPLSRDKLMEMARGREYEAFDRSLDVQVSRLRNPIRASRATCRRFGDWATSSFRTILRTPTRPDFRLRSIRGCLRNSLEAAFFALCRGYNAQTLFLIFDRQLSAVPLKWPPPITPAPPICFGAPSFS